MNIKIWQKKRETIHFSEGTDEAAVSVVHTPQAILLNLCSFGVESRMFLLLNLKEPLRVLRF